ncbi:hypothetical protein TMatcc_008594 [Talaromyces marneffei ATCC 18224]
MVRDPPPKLRTTSLRGWNSC